MTLHPPSRFMLWASGLCMSLACMHCGTIPKEWAMHAGVPTTQSAREDEGPSLRASVRGAREDRALSITPAASFARSTRQLTTLALGVDVRLFLDPERFDTPIPLLMSVGFDALNMGCQEIPACHLGTAGVHGEVGVQVYRHETRGAWSVSVGWDQDVRFGPRSNTSFLTGVRWTPAAQNH